MLLKIKKLAKWLIIILFVALLAVGGFFAYRALAYPIKYEEYVFYYADEFGVDRALVFSVIKSESGFDKNAVSSKGAVGLMQITSATGEYIADLLGEKNFDLTNENTNIKYGTFYLRYLLNKFVDVETALSAYNAGEGNVNKWLSNREYSANGKTLDKIPYAETQRYVEKTYKSFTKYQKLYGYLLDKSK